MELQVELQCTEATSFDKCPAALAEPSQGRHSHSVHKQVLPRHDGTAKMYVSGLVPTHLLLQVMLLFPHAADDTIAQELVEWFKHEVCDQSSSCAGNTQEYDP